MKLNLCICKNIITEYYNRPKDSILLFSLKICILELCVEATSQEISSETLTLLKKRIKMTFCYLLTYLGKFPQCFKYSLHSICTAGMQRSLLIFNCAPYLFKFYFPFCEFLVGEGKKTSRQQCLQSRNWNSARFLLLAFTISEADIISHHTKSNFRDKATQLIRSLLKIVHTDLHNPIYNECAAE